MTAVPVLQRAAAVIRSGDVVRLDDGSRRTVSGNPTSGRSAIGGLTILIRFKGGGSLRVSAGARLDIERAE